MSIVTNITVNITKRIIGIASILYLKDSIILPLNKQIVALVNPQAGHKIPSQVLNKQGIGIFITNNNIKNNNIKNNIIIFFNLFMLVA